MDTRLDYFADPTAGEALRHLMSAGKPIKESPLPTVLREVVVFGFDEAAPKRRAAF